MILFGDDFTHLCLWNAALTVTSFLRLCGNKDKRMFVFLKVGNKMFSAKFL